MINTASGPVILISIGLGIIYIAPDYFASGNIWNSCSREIVDFHVPRSLKPHPPAITILAVLPLALGDAARLPVLQPYVFSIGGDVCHDEIIVAAS